MSSLNRRIDELSKDYKRVFITNNGDGLVQRKLFRSEFAIRDGVDVALNNYFLVILKRLNAGSSFRNIEPSVEGLQSLTQKLDKDEVIPGPLNLNFQTFFPYKKGTIKTICSAITRICFGEPLTKISEKMDEETAIGGSLESVRIKFASKESEFRGRLEIPENAVIIFVMNHDNGIAEAKLFPRLMKKLGVERNLVVTTKRAFPWYKILPNPDKNIFFVENKSFMKRIVHEFSSFDSGRIAVTIFPEGGLATYGAQMPMISKMGAFVWLKKQLLLLRIEGPFFW